MSDMLTDAMREGTEYERIDNTPPADSRLSGEEWERLGTAIRQGIGSVPSSYWERAHIALEAMEADHEALAAEVTRLQAALALSEETAKVLESLLNEHDSFVLSITHHHDAPNRHRHESAHHRADEVVREWRGRLDAEAQRRLGGDGE